MSGAQRPGRRRKPPFVYCNNEQTTIPRHMQSSRAQVVDLAQKSETLRQEYDVPPFLLRSAGPWGYSHYKDTRESGTVQGRREPHCVHGNFTLPGRSHSESGLKYISRPTCFYYISLTSSETGILSSFLAFRK